MYFLLQTMLTVSKDCNNHINNRLLLLPQCVHVPYTALTVHLSYNQKEIDSVTLYSKQKAARLYCLLLLFLGVIFEMFGTLFGIGVYTVSYAVFVHGTEECVGQKSRDFDKVKNSII